MNKSLKLTMIVVASIAAVGVVGFATSSSVDAAAPGDFFYGLDRAYEAVGSVFQFSDTDKADYDLDLLEERTAEAIHLEEEGEEELLSEALDNLEAAEEATLERIREAEDNENSDDGELERVRDRMELKLEEALRAKEKLKEMYEDKGDEAGAKEVEESMEQMKNNAEQEYKYLEDQTEDSEDDSNSDDSDSSDNEQERKDEDNTNSYQNGNESDDDSVDEDEANEIED